MDELKDLAYDSISHYFDLLSKIGYKSDEEVKKLFVLLTIEEVLDKYRNYINEDDYRVLNNVLYCLYGSSCLINYPEYILNVLINNENEDILNYITISEDDEMIFTEDNSLILTEEYSTH